MPRPRKRSDAEILEVARAVFLEQGPSASMADVARQLGLTQPALSSRFGSKQALLLRALAPALNADWISALERLPDARPFPAQLRELGVRAMELLEVAVPCMMTIRVAGVGALASEGATKLPHARVRDAVVGVFSRALARGLVRDAEPERMAMMLIGSLQARAMMAYVEGRALATAERSAHVDAVVDVLWRGLQPERQDHAKGQERA